MTTKEKILLYFRDINYAYNDCTRLDALEKGLSELEEVVRCKDCKHSRKDDIFHTRWCQKPGHCKVVKDEFYCAWGEREDDE